ncbi:MPN domain-containing protein [Folsomia candida]|uniref:MPN domain-containing protein n=1 Tax=Folsomia candida TaxID=158441 RepID=A0A226F715_FOLCA|nr:MPN domain-containing protein [Folsomia candida]XP_021963059.1 MPN domain-containing protein [Folsomia candida]OXA65001.1 MPN domain-containing protein [Folsomia candida]
MMDKEAVPVVNETQNNNNHHHNNSYLEDTKDDDEAAKCSSNNDIVSDGDTEVNNINNKDISETEQTNNDTSPFPPCKIARRSKDSNRKSASSPRMKTSTPNSMAGTPAGSSSEREPNSSPASIDNPPTNGSINNDTFGDGERSDKTESGDSHSISSSTFQTTNGPHNHMTPTFTKRSVTLQMLLEAGILKQGEGTMSLEYHGQKFIGDLSENGQIRSQETSLQYSSPSAWAIACKQIINPDKILRKSGCGWASIKYKGLKLDYYKTVWFKRLREGAIDIRHISNGASSTSDDGSDDEDHSAFCVLKFGEHLDNNPILQSAQQLGAKVMISCSRFQEIDRLQPFYVKITSEALALADFHCNITGTESLGYISGRWNSDENSLSMEIAHPCKVLMPNSSSIDCDIERNRIALEIQRLGHDVVGWYHSHPKAPPQPSKDDISRQLDYQIVMKGASESSYIPCVGVIISPLCYSNQEDLTTSPVQFFWVMPPPENRPLDIGRPMNIEYDTYSPTNVNLKQLLEEMASLIQFYKEKKDLVDINDLTSGRYEKLQESFSSIISETRMNVDFWDEVKLLFNAPILSVACASSAGSSNVSTSSVSSTSAALNSVSTPNSVVSNSTPPVASTPVDETPSTEHNNHDAPP